MACKQASKSLLKSFPIFSHSGAPWSFFINMFYSSFPRRCAAHSLQLLLGDLYKLSPLANASRFAEAILYHFTNADELVKLENVQKATGKDVLSLIKPVSTRC